MLWPVKAVFEKRAAVVEVDAFISPEKKQPKNRSNEGKRNKTKSGLITGIGLKLGEYPLRRNDYQNNSVKIILCNCPGAITGFLCIAPENNSPNVLSCKSPCPVRAPPPRSLSRNHRDYGEGALTGCEKIIPQKFYYVIAPGALTGFSCRAPENNSKIIFSCL